MIIVTNTIKVEKGYEEQVIKQFTESVLTRSITEVEGFLGFELWKTNLTPDIDYGEVIVMSKWTDAESQKAWVKSESFKKIHGRTKESREQKRDRKGIINNHVMQYEVVHNQSSPL
ncbi:antibiotic biosynthesis monooxygenase [Listeria sp. PSOL-1]|uniref:antibiotic biosynthesis monooxygenase n=1 Tax=Listeria sp. PSOL-1 TaxID=1844999 RepID=UPI0013D25550|nr:antibiotic biosynthesis monooxygenase [Listeria sp. PSOL-1]